MLFTPFWYDVGMSRLGTILDKNCTLDYEVCSLSRKVFIFLLNQE